MDTGCTDLSGHTILIVEDKPILALNLQIALEAAGAEAVIVRGPQEALARLRQFTFSAAIIDPKQSALIGQVQQRGVLVVTKPASGKELLARLGVH